MPFTRLTNRFPQSYWAALRRVKATPLGRHLLAVLFLKAALLMAIWHVFVAPKRVVVDAAAAEARWLQGGGGPVSGNHSREKNDDRSTSH